MGDIVGNAAGRNSTSYDLKTEHEKKTHEITIQVILRSYSYEGSKVFAANSVRSTDKCRAKVHTDMELTFSAHTARLHTQLNIRE